MSDAHVFFSTAVFAPLRGLYYLISKRAAIASVFAPLRGWYEETKEGAEQNAVFAPLRGWYTKYITEYRKMEELNA